MPQTLLPVYFMELFDECQSRTFCLLELKLALF